jgi:RimJ/RimL family protein N-acetyltransferase
MIEFSLTGRHVRLEPLHPSHIPGLVRAAAADPTLYQWSLVPQTESETQRYVDTALSWRQAGTAYPFAIVRMQDGLVLGSTRFWNIERWSWPAGHARHGRESLDVCEIGYTWLSSAAVRTAANTEAKRLMLGHAFESWQALRVCFCTDERNSRSRAALERIGARCEGILRSHRMAADYAPRNTVSYSIIAAEWPAVRGRLDELLVGSLQR